MDIKKYYSESFAILKRHKKIILFCILVYLISAIGGFIYYGLNYETLKETSVKSDMTAEEYHELRLDKSDFFINHYFDIYLLDGLINILVTAVRIASGILFGIIPTLLLIIDGLTTSNSILLSVFEDSIIGIVFQSLCILSQTLALIPASALGISLFLSIFQSKQRLKNITSALKDSLIVFITIIIPLLLIATIFNWLSLII